MGEVSLQGAYVDYLTGGLGWDKLWMEVHKQSTICINRLCKKTGARVPPKEKAELITDTDIRVMERLKKKNTSEMWAALSTMRRAQNWKNVVLHLSMRAMRCSSKSARVSRLIRALSQDAPRCYASLDSADPIVPPPVLRAWRYQYSRRRTNSGYLVWGYIGLFWQTNCT